LQRPFEGGTDGAGIKRVFRRIVAPVDARKHQVGFFGQDVGSLPTVTVDSAMQVPAVAAAVNFLSRSMAALPLHLYRDGANGAEKVDGSIARILHDAPNAETTAFKWRQGFWQNVFTGGRGLSWIERNSKGAAIGIWDMDPTRTAIERKNGKIQYSFGGSQVLGLN